jgi:RNA polymerase sigma factor (sigma-70 family)
MADGRLSLIVRHLRQVAGGPINPGHSDGQLLERFAWAGEEAAFAALMRRHGRMVLGVCRRVLQNETDVEDAFQATFLTLVRRARSIRKRESVGSWLHGVAFRLALRSRSDAARRSVGEQEASIRTFSEPGFVAAWRELQEVLDEELHRLPEKYRLPLVLCYLEGETQEEVAQRLGWPVGTVKGRLARARELMRVRLVRRGLTLGSASLATVLAVETASAVPPALAASAARFAWETVWRQSAQTIPVRVTALADTIMRTWYVAKLKLVASVLLAAGFVAAGAGYMASRTAQDPSDPLPDVSQSQESPPSVATITPSNDLYGDPLPDGVVARIGTTRLRAGRPLYRFEFSPDGQIVAAAGERAVFLWDAASGKELRRLEGHRGRVFPVAFAPDGQTVATGGIDHTVRVWDVASAKELRRLEGHRGPVGEVAFSPDGKLLISGALDKTVRVWDAATGRELRQLQLEGNRGTPHFYYRFLADNRTLATLDETRILYLWDIETGREIRRFDPQLKPYDEVALSADGGKLAAAGRGTAIVHCWEVATGRLLSTLIGHRGAVQAVAFSPDGKTLATSATDRTLRFWDVATGAEQRRLGVDEAQREGLVFSGDGRILASGRDGIIRLWHVDSGQESVPVEGHQALIRLVAFSPDGQRILSFGRDHTVCSWDAVTGKLMDARRRGADETVTAEALALTSDGRVMACAGVPDGSIILRDTETGAERGRLQGHAGTTLALDVVHAAFAPDGTTLVSGGFDKTVRLWDVATSRELRRFGTDLPEISAVAYSPKGRAFATGGRNGVVYVWNAENGEVVHRFDGPSEPIRGLAFSPDGLVVAAAFGKHFEGGPGTVVLWDMATGRQLHQLPGHAIRGHGLAFSPDGKMLATCGADCKVRLWDPVGGTEIAQLDGHRGAVVSVAFSPDGKRLASGSMDATVLVWNVEERRSSESEP